MTPVTSTLHRMVADHDAQTPKQKLERFEDLARKLLKVPKAEIKAAEGAREKRQRRRD